MNTAGTTQMGTVSVAQSSGQTESVRTESPSNATGSTNTRRQLSSGTMEEIPVFQAHRRSDVFPARSDTPIAEAPSSLARPDIEDKDTVGSISELEAAGKELTENYEIFITRNEKFLSIPEDALNSTFLQSDTELDIRQAAQALGQRVRTVLRTVEQKHKIGQEKWSTKVGSFLTKCYPIARLTLGLAGAIGEVISSSPIV